MNQDTSAVTNRTAGSVGGILVRVGANVAPADPLTWRDWAGRAGLAVLPLLLALGFYYRPVLRGGLALLPVSYDAGFYVYQLTRAAELGGRWWLLGDDELLGHPYPTAVAKHPGLYEGVDLMLVSTLTARFLPPALNYHAMILLVLLANGWVAAWLVRRLTGSYFWAAVAVVLLTVNTSTAMRLNGHLHLFKYGWVLLAVWCFVRYLDAPSVGRGVLLGLAGALLLQGSFYLAFLLTLVLGVWWAGCLVTGRLGRRHVAATCAAGLTAAALGAVLTFPVWALHKDVALADDYFHRERRDVWWYGADLWQYFVSPRLAYGQELAQAREKPTYEGWHYAGLTVLLAVAAYAVLRLRGRKLPVADPRLVDRLMGLIGLCVLLSLSGGPSAFLFSVVSSFRAYGRAGLLAVALWSVAAPLVLHGLVRQVPDRRLRGLLCAGALGLALFDANVIVRSPLGMMFPQPHTPPAWVDWAALQPADVSVVVFPDPSLHVDAALRPWEGLYHRALHRHRTLNGCELSLLKADLERVGAAPERMNADGLRVVLALGYNTLVFRQDYLHAHPWVAHVPWLERAEVVGDWHIFRANARLPALAARPMHELLAGQRDFTQPARVPARSWITGRFDLDQPVVVPDHVRVRLAWADADGRLVTKPTPALLQRVFIAAHPAYRALTPRRPGRYELVFLDDQERRLATRSYEVADDLRTHPAAPGDQVPSVSGTTLEAGAGRTTPLRVTVTNATPYYLQAHAGRPLRPTSGPERGSLTLHVRVSGPGGDGLVQERLLALPADLPPHGRLELELPDYLLPPGGAPVRIEVRPHFQELAAPVVAAGAAEVRLEPAGAVARSR